MSDIVRREFNGKMLRARNATRWNSEYIMCERAVEFDWHNSKLSKEYKMSGGQLDLLREYVAVMELFQEAFKTLQYTKSPDISAVLPVVFALHDKMTVQYFF